MTRRTREEALARVKETERIIEAVTRREVVLCTTCQKPLTYYGPDSGRHPGVYCPTGCTKIFMEMGNR